MGNSNIYSWRFSLGIVVLCVVMLIVLLLIIVSLYGVLYFLGNALLAALGLDGVFVTKVFFAIQIIIVGLTTIFVYYTLADWLSHSIFANSPIGLSQRDALQPWLFVGPALILLLLFLIYPALETFRLSLTNDVNVLDVNGGFILDQVGREKTVKGFVGLQNYRFLLNTEDFWFAIRNSVLWLLIVPATCIFFGMLIAVLADRLFWGRLAKTLIFIPLAISFVGAAVIWRNIYAAGGVGGYEIGLLNALLKPLGVMPRFWYETHFWGNFFMMAILIWIQSGFAMVIFSAALRSVPEEIIEAACIDGASEAQIFFRITLPQIYGTVLVVWTTLVILVLKVFDIPYALTANKSDKLLLATLMEQTRTAQREEELAAAVAIILILTIIPVLVFNVWRTKRQNADA